MIKKQLDPDETAFGWYSVEEVFQWINRKRSVFDDKSRCVPTDVYSREFAVWLTKEIRLAMAKGIQMANDQAPESAREIAERLGIKSEPQVHVVG